MPGGSDASNGMMTAAWGPALWHVLHTVSVNYPQKPTEAHKNDYAAFFSSLAKVLPCSYCRQNYPDNLKRCGGLARALEGREEMARFVYDLHSEVNGTLRKDRHPLTYDEVRKKYEAFRARCSNSSNSSKALAAGGHLGCIAPQHGAKKVRCVVRVIDDGGDETEIRRSILEGLLRRTERRIS